jgi:hypothetical protein
MNLQSLFSPLGKEYCMYFYWLSVIGFFFFWVLLLSGIVVGIKSKMPAAHYLHLGMICISYALLYFQSRLLYSVCMR